MPSLTEAQALMHMHSIQAFGGDGTVKTGGDKSWHIKNKYYEADVQFEVAAASDLGFALVYADYPAVILLAERGHRPGEYVKEILSNIQERNQRTEPHEIGLLVSYPTTSVDDEDRDMEDDDDRDLEEDLWDDMALYNGFEWIDVATPSYSGERGEKNGIERVVEALQAHQWEGSVMASRDPVKDGPTVDVTSEEEVDEEEEESAMSAPPLPDPRPWVPTPSEFPSTFLPSIPRGDKATSKPAPIEFDDDFAPFVPALESTSFPDSDPAFAPSIPSKCDRDLDGEGAREEEDDGLDEMFSKLQGLRETGEGMSLQERRELAERAIVDLLGEP